ncbi:hypothetical protein P171DRAFT_347804 [Karstenula rhodostoma CBS 690.94]|uniref:Large ribosomal subunit protein mL67 n=1 Tax=Karstenula rhodostoma CBS 690.94 TaxID=1392251 RepID=A0A9P4PXH5_9PLEO|nr:hypothetical protein P171DRAFT_347804 [Karstenula rhodostoma CBS 690.94]
MPRNLARLRFRAPKQLRPLNIARIHPEDHTTLHRRLRAHALDLSKPQTPLSLQVVVNPKWKQQPGKKPFRMSYKPHTVRDLVDPEAAAKHGQIIYVFANIKTGQVIYSLNELLDQYHLDQLPFLGKHSKPPTVRPDEWTPHCVITFPVAEQGLQAFRKLREFRHLHETSWDKTNPEWVRLTPHQRMRKIMDQVANTSADLAAVLSVQQQQSVEMRKKTIEHEKKSFRLMKTMWAEAEALAKDDRDASNPKWLEQQIRNLEWQLGTKRNRDEADTKRLQDAKKGHEVRLRRVLRARKNMARLKEVEETSEFKKMQEGYASQAAPATGVDVEAKLETLRKELALERDLTKVLDRSQEDAEQTMGAKQAEITQLEDAFIASLRAEARDHPVTRSILPTELKKQPPQPFTMDVEIKWADLRNAEYAAGNWPDPVVHDTLALRSSREDVQLLNPEQYNVTVSDDVQAMLKNLERQALEAQGLYEEPVAEPEPEKTGVWKYIPEVKNPFKRAEA